MQKPFSPTKKQYFDGVSIGDRKVIQLIYDRYFAKIESFIKSNNGSNEDAKDIFQDALMAIYVKTKNDGLDNLECSFYTFLYAICRNLWLKKLRKRKHKLLEDLDDVDYKLQSEVMQSIGQKERWAFYREKFRLLNAPCQKILLLFFEKYNFSEISEKLGFGSANYAKKKKYLCKQKLIELMTTDKRFKELNDQ